MKNKDSTGPKIFFLAPRVTRGFNDCRLSGDPEAGARYGTY